ncbi:MAG: bifunctional phosphoglucose/phosphomannose isomerase [Candidatus Kapabacteria bacterium]|nr:bifunctional phosphoglucose/phosphomannose isomerase [Candidatus Kapabacteria bacterium]
MASKSSQPKVGDLFNADKANMFNVLLTFPEQVRHAISIGDEAAFFTNKPESNDVVVLGLGGSAIGGDLVRSYCAATAGADSLNISVSRGYTLPGTVNDKTLVVASSYSGDTEETLSAYQTARKKTKNLLCISTGGKISAMAKKQGVPLITIPKGFQPRCALGYSFFPLLATVMRHPSVTAKARKNTQAALLETIDVLDKLSGLYAMPGPKNPAFQLAKKLAGTAPVIYSANERMDAVNLRWRGQIQENAKNVAFGHVLPEMNHNEINGWGYPKGVTKNFSVVLLRDVDDHPRVKIRFDALKGIIKSNVKSIYEVHGEGTSLMARMFSAIYLGDWVSFYMAMLNNVDPSPVPVIMKLKAMLADAK